MAITITATLDASGVKTGSAQAGASLDGLANKAENSTDKLDQVAAELSGDLAQLKGQANALEAELDQMADSGANSFDKIGDAAQRAGTEARDVSKGVSGTVTAIGVGFLSAMGAIDKLGQGIGKAVQLVGVLASDGNAAAVELQGAFGEIQSELLGIAESPAIQDAMRDISAVIREDLLPIIAEIPEAFDAVEMAAARALIAVNLQAGKITPQMADAAYQFLEFAKVGRAMAHEINEQQREQRKARDREKVILQELAGIEYDRSKQAFEDRLKEIDSVEELTASQMRLADELKREALANKSTEESRRVGLDKIRAMEDRIATIRAKGAETEKESASEVTRSLETEIEKRSRIEAEFAAIRDKHAADEVDGQARAHQASLDMERRAIDERKRLLNGKDGNAAEQLLKGQDPALVRRAFAERQAAEATAKARREAAADGDDSPADNKRDEREIAKQRQKALANAQRQFDRGQADPRAVMEAQQGLADQAVRAAFDGGKLSKETAMALHESTRELLAIQAEQDATAREIENLKKIVGAAAMQGQRRRGQNAGARQ